jgi:hypothetical protein
MPRSGQVRKYLNNIPNRIAQCLRKETKSDDKTESKNLIMKVRLSLIIKATTKEKGGAQYEGLARPSLMNPIDSRPIPIQSSRGTKKQYIDSYRKI